MYTQQRNVATAILRQNFSAFDERRALREYTTTRRIFKKHSLFKYFLEGLHETQVSGMMEGACVEADYSLYPGVSVPGALKVLAVIAGLPGALLLALADAVQEQFPG